MIIFSCVAAGARRSPTSTLSPIRKASTQRSRTLQRPFAPESPSRQARWTISRRCAWSKQSTRTRIGTGGSLRVFDLSVGDWIVFAYFLISPRLDRALLFPIGWRLDCFAEFPGHFLLNTYGHHHPDHLREAADAFGSRSKKNVSVVESVVGQNGGRRKIQKC